MKYLLHCLQYILDIADVSTTAGPPRAVARHQGFVPLLVAWAQANVGKGGVSTMSLGYCASATETLTSIEPSLEVYALSTLSSLSLLSRRERQIVDALYKLGEGTVHEVVQVLREPEAYHTIRVTLATMERKGVVKHRQDCGRNIYFPTIPRNRAREGVLSHVVHTFFGGSTARAVLSFLDLSGDQLSQEELAELEDWVRTQSRRKRNP